jgi:hypothetical protein
MINYSGTYATGKLEEVKPIGKSAMGARIESWTSWIPENSSKRPRGAEEDTGRFGESSESR